MHLTGWLVGFWAPLPLPTQRRHAVGAPLARALLPRPARLSRLGLLGPLLPGQPCHLVATIRTAGQYPSGGPELNCPEHHPCHPPRLVPTRIGTNGSVAGFRPGATHMSPPCRDIGSGPHGKPGLRVETPGHWRCWRCPGPPGRVKAESLAGGLGIRNP